MRIKSEIILNGKHVEFEFDGTPADMEELPSNVKKLKESLEILASSQS